MDNSFYDLVYAMISSPAPLEAINADQFIDIVFKVMKNDKNSFRTCSFIKRVLQACLYQPINVACGYLYLISNIFQLKQPLRRQLTHNTKSQKKAAVPKPKKPKDKNRKAQYKKHQFAYRPFSPHAATAGGEKECMWELLPLLHHYHPIIREWSNKILEGTPVLITTNPLVAFKPKQLVDHLVSLGKPKSTKKLLKEGRSQPLHRDLLEHPERVSIQHTFMRDFLLHKKKEKQERQAIRVTKHLSQDEIDFRREVEEAWMDHDNDFDFARDEEEFVDVEDPADQVFEMNEADLARKWVKLNREDKEGKENEGDSEDHDEESSFDFDEFDDEDFEALLKEESEDEEEDKDAKEMNELEEAGAEFVEMMEKKVRKKKMNQKNTLRNKGKRKFSGDTPAFVKKRRD